MHIRKLRNKWQCIVRIKNIAYLQSELTKEWYTPNITTQDIQAENPNPMFRCVKCDKEWVVINEKNIRC